MSWEDDGPEPLIDLSNWEIPRTAYYPAYFLSAILIVAWLWHARSGGMSGWGVSASALRQRHFEAIPLHMIAHAGLVHLLFNVLALIQVGGPLATCLGKGWRGGGGFYALLVASGLAGMV